MGTQGALERVGVGLIPFLHRDGRARRGGSRAGDNGGGDFGHSRRGGGGGGDGGHRGSRGIHNPGVGGGGVELYVYLLRLCCVMNLFP